MKMVDKVAESVGDSVVDVVGVAVGLLEKVCSEESDPLLPENSSPFLLLDNEVVLLE